MYFVNYVHGNIRVKTGELRTGGNPKTALVWKDLKGADVIDDDGNTFLLTFGNKSAGGRGVNLFIVTRDGQVYNEVFKEIDEDGNLVMENGFYFDPKNIVFIGESKDN